MAAHGGEVCAVNVAPHGLGVRVGVRKIGVKVAICGNLRVWVGVCLCEVRHGVGWAAVKFGFGYKFLMGGVLAGNFGFY